MPQPRRPSSIKVWALLEAHPSRTSPRCSRTSRRRRGKRALELPLLFGGFNSVLDAALPLSLMIKARKAGIPNNELAAEWYKRFGKGALKGFATEGATEAAQEMSSAAAAKFVDNTLISSQRRILSVSSMPVSREDLVAVWCLALQMSCLGRSP